MLLLMGWIGTRTFMLLSTLREVGVNLKFEASFTYGTFPRLS